MLSVEADGPTGRRAWPRAISARRLGRLSLELSSTTINNGPLRRRDGSADSPLSSQGSRRLPPTAPAGSLVKIGSLNQQAEKRTDNVSRAAAGFQAMRLGPRVVSQIVPGEALINQSDDNPTMREVPMPYIRFRGPYAVLVHSRREGDRVRQLHLAYLGKRRRLEPELRRRLEREYPELEFDWAALERRLARGGGKRRDDTWLEED